MFCRREDFLKGIWVKLILAGFSLFRGYIFVTWFLNGYENACPSVVAGAGLCIIASPLPTISWGQWQYPGDPLVGYVTGCYGLKRFSVFWLSVGCNLQWLRIALYGCSVFWTCMCKTLSPGSRLVLYWPCFLVHAGLKAVTLSRAWLFDLFFKKICNDTEGFIFK